MTIIYKNGRPSNNEIKEIMSMVRSGLSITEISEKTNRNPVIVKELIDKNISIQDMITDDKLDITKSTIWQEICRQFTPQEQHMFIYHWVETCGQFKNDITHTERLQIIDMIRNDMLMNRVLQKMKEDLEELSDIKKQYEDEMQKSVDIRDLTLVASLQRQISDKNVASGAYNREYKDLADKKQQILRDIKGTREQRVKRVEESRETLTGWMANLLANPETRSKLGKELEKNRLATKVEYIRLSDFHKYTDGQLDKPILNHETNGDSE